MRGLASLVLPFLLLASFANAAHAPCPPEDCTPVVPIPDVPYVTGVRLVSFHADVDVVHGIATTTLTLVLKADATAQAQLALPMPAGASLVGFNLTVGGTVLEGRVRESLQATREYNEAVAGGRDAALLEQASERLVRLSVNVPEGDERTLRATYAEVVERAAGSRVYRLPISQVHADGVAIDFAIKGAGAGTVRFPSLPAVDQGNGTWRHEGRDVDADFVAVWSEGAGLVATLVASHPAGQPAAWVAQVCLEAPVPLARDVVFVLDRSGSMDGQKMLQARTAMAGALEALGPADRYDVVAFDDHVDPFHDALRPVEAGRVAADRAELERTTARGGTDIDAALQAALRLLAASPSDRLPMVVFVTDGLPSSGVVDHDEIIERFRAANTRGAVVQVVPIGLDADHTFLADLALRSGGRMTSIDPAQGSVAMRLARHFDVIGRPVLRDVELEVHGINAQERYPDPLPPVYEDGCLVATLRGLLPADGLATLVVRGQRAAGPGGDVFEPATETLHVAPYAVEVVPAAERIWARHHIDALLSRERVEDLDLRDTIVQEAVRLRQLSPYTSWVITDQGVPEPKPVKSTSCASCGAIGGDVDSGSYAYTQRGGLPPQDLVAGAPTSYARTTTGGAAIDGDSGLGVTTTVATPASALALAVTALALVLALRRRLA